MKFGSIEEGAVIDRGPLPPDNPLTLEVLRQKPVQGCKIYVGCPEWGSDAYAGVLFPKTTKPKAYRVVYAKQFNCVELNATGYRIPSADTVQGWTSDIPDDFLFCPKVPQPISQSSPIGKDAPLRAFEASLDQFGGHLGAVFLMLHPNFGVNRYGELTRFLESWNPKYPLHIELRNTEWFENHDARGKLFGFMAAKTIGTVITDVPGFQSALHQTLTTRGAYIRFSDSGEDVSPNDYVRLTQWAERSSEWIELGLERLFFFCHGVNSANAPVLCDYFIGEMNRLTNAALKRPELLKI